jgi:type II secretory pathway pseudopilin PulG
VFLLMMLGKNISENSGMTRLQLLILVIIVVVIGVLSFPPWLEYRKVSTADIDVETITVAIKKYFRHTESYPTSFDALVKDPGIEGWRGNYLESIPETPWGGRYVLFQDAYKVAIAKDHPRVPEKYRVGGIAEISRVYHADAHLGEKYWW